MRNMAEKKIAVIVPAYNEEKKVRQVINGLLKEQHLINFTIIVINDGSTDLTDEILNSYKNKIILISYKENRGKGYALRRGSDLAYKAGFDFIIWIDGDAQHNPPDIQRFIKALTQGYQLVIHRRIIDFQVVPQSKIGRYIVRTFFNLLFSSKIFDHISGYRAFAAEIYPKIRWRASDYRVEIEMLARAIIHKISYTEIKTRTQKKLYRGITYRDGIKILYWIVVCFIKRKYILETIWSGKRNSISLSLIRPTS